MFKGYFPFRDTWGTIYRYVDVISGGGGINGS